VLHRIPCNLGAAMKRGYPSAKVPRSQMKPPPKSATETNDSLVRYDVPQTLPEGVLVLEESGHVCISFPYALINGETLTMALMLDRNEAFAVGSAILDEAQQLPEEK
jgi:hypothetical protein